MATAAGPTHYRPAAGLLLLCTYFIFSQGIVELEVVIGLWETGQRPYGSKVYLLFRVTSAFLFPLFSQQSDVTFATTRGTRTPASCILAACRTATRSASRETSATQARRPPFPRGNRQVSKRPSCTESGTRSVSRFGYKFA